MKILIRLPNWIGDVVMSTVAVENLRQKYGNITLVGNRVALEFFDNKRYNLIVDDSKVSKFRILEIYKLAQRVGEHDISITFQNTFLSALFLFFTKSKVRIGFKKEFRAFLLTHGVKNIKNIHQVEKYLILAKEVLGSCDFTLKQNIKWEKKYPRDKKIGINFGGAFGMAKRWNIENFAKLATMLPLEYEIIIFGSKDDFDNSLVIEDRLKSRRYQNLTGKTNISELIEHLGSIELLITNDSGPMHIAAALDVKIVAIFGPTDMNETHPWCENYKIVSIDLDCSPCKNRICEKRDHQCMNGITPELVLEKIKIFLLG